MSGAPAYPKAQQTITGLDGGAYVGGPPRGVWHETITAPSEFYTGNTYYHIQFRQWPLTAKPESRQFIPFTRASRALRNLSSASRVDVGLSAEDIQTNREGSVNINVALVGYQTAKAGGYPSLYPLTDAMVNELSEFIEWCEAEHGIPADLSALISEPGQQEYGYLSPLRFTNEEWVKFSGWCGHERVTENTHHDPYYLFAQQMQALDLTPQTGGLMAIPDYAKAAVKKAEDGKFLVPGTESDLIPRYDLMVWLDRLGAFEDFHIDESGEVQKVNDRVAALEAKVAGLPTSSGKDAVARAAIADLKSNLHSATAP